jgi:hypothetical protein
MKSLAVLFLILFGAGSALAQDATQPVTRADCEKTPGWSWSEHAGVCEA